MTVMSFAHLKGNGGQRPAQIPAPPSSGVVIPATPAEPKAGVSRMMSFAHLKTKRSAHGSSPIQAAPVPVQRLQRPKGIGIMKTAFLAAVNYCEGCPRFWPSDDQEKETGAPYGRCCRSSEDGVEEWKSIPLTARVSRCWYHMEFEAEKKNKVEGKDEK